MPALARRAVRLLLERGLMSAADVHRYGVTARDVSESNAVVLVELGNGRGFAVKDVSSSRDTGQGSPAQEIALYRTAGAHPGCARILPRLELHDQDTGLLVLEGVISARRLDRLDTSGCAASFGRALGAWHQVGADLPRLAATRPWLLDIAGPARLPVLTNDGPLRSLTDALLDDPSHRAALDLVRTAWAADTAIHGDVRFTNVLIRSSGEAVLVDWESSGLGDSRWDVAGGVQEYLSAGRPIEAFLDGYAVGRGRPVEAAFFGAFVACRLLLRALQLANWMDEPEAEIERHRSLARSLLESPWPLPLLGLA
ncbi:phosphotransferase family protein [Nonomuraea sp. NPDC050556]|uniref:phosphotransferase family protein n=1 Tax=Nonomuraea sp. NPDC050556 TaxID=3364369 RepID=UPI0037B4630C